MEHSPPKSVELMCVLVENGVGYAMTIGNTGTQLSSAGNWVILVCIMNYGMFVRRLSSHW